MLSRHSNHQRLLHYTKLLTSHVNNSRHEEALALFSHMHSTLDLDPFAFPLALKSSAALRLPRVASAVHARTLKAGLLSNPFIASALVDAYGKCTDVSIARQLFDEIPQRNAVVWNAMISLCSRTGDVGTALRLLEEMDVSPSASTFNSIIGAIVDMCDGSPRALRLYRKMRSLGVEANLITILALLPAAAGVGGLNLVKEIHGFVTRKFIQWHYQVSRGLVEAYGRCGGLRSARLVFDGMPERDVVAWSAMISAYALQGEAEVAMDMFRAMDAANVQPDGIMFLAVLKACSHAGLADGALKYFELLNGKYGLKASSDHYSCLVDVLSRAGRLKEAYDVIRGMPVPVTAKAWGALLGACRSYGNVQLAEIAGRALIKIEPENSANFIILASIYAAAGQFEEAERVRRELKERFMRRAPGSSWVVSSR